MKLAPTVRRIFDHQCKKTFSTASTQRRHWPPEFAVMHNGWQVAKSFRYILTDPREFDILRCRPGLRASDAIRSIEATRVRHPFGWWRSRVAARRSRTAGGQATDHRVPGDRLFAVEPMDGCFCAATAWTR